MPNGDVTNPAHRWEWIDETEKGMLAIWNGTSNTIVAPSYTPVKRRQLVEKDLRNAARPYLNYALDIP